MLNFLFVFPKPRQYSNKAGRPLCGWQHEERFKRHDVRPVSRDDSADILPRGEDRRTTNDACFRNKPGHEPLPDG